MSKTIRHYIGGLGRDGKKDWPTRIVRRRDRLAQWQTPPLQRPLRILRTVAGQSALSGELPAAQAI